MAVSKNKKMIAEGLLGSDGREKGRRKKEEWVSCGGCRCHPYRFKRRTFCFTLLQHLRTFDHKSDNSRSSSRDPLTKAIPYRFPAQPALTSSSLGLFRTLIQAFIFYQIVARLMMWPGSATAGVFSQSCPASGGYWVPSRVALGLVARHAYYLE